MVECCKCGSKNLLVYKESVITRNYKITKEGKKSKKVSIRYEGNNSHPEGVACEDCGALHDYDIDSKTQVIREIWLKG